jgi:O-antigen/teichoic acid export membrane protein
MAEVQEEITAAIGRPNDSHRHSTRRLISNSVAMALANVAGRGLGYVSLLLLARHVSAHYIGVYAILLTTSMLAELVSNLGLDKVVVREMAPSAHSGYDRKLFWLALGTRLCMAVVSFAAAFALLRLLFKDLGGLDEWTIAVYLSVIFPTVASRNCEALLTAHERLRPIAWSQAFERIVMFGAVLLLINGHLSFAGFICFAPIAGLGRLSVLISGMAAGWSSVGEQSPLGVNELLRQSIQLFSVEVLALVYFRSDVFFIARIQGLSSAGVYQIAYKMFDCCISLFSGLLQAAFPLLIRNRSRRYLGQLLIYGLIAVSVPVAIVIVLRYPLLEFIQPGYSAGATSLVWLMLTAPLVYVNSTLSNAAIAAGKVKILIVLAIVLIGSNVGLNLALIPRWSINGAAFATFACEALSSLILVPAFLLTGYVGAKRP